MEKLSQPQKTDAANARWRAIVEKGTKPQRRALRFFIPYFVARGEGPHEVTNAGLADIVNGLEENAARKHFGQSDKENRHAGNSFVNALADIDQRACLGLPTLDRLPALDAEERAAKSAFEARFDAEFKTFFANYRLPDIHRTDEMREKIAAKGRALISPANEAGLINGLFNAAKIVEAAGVQITCLADLFGAKALEVLTPAVKKESPGRARQMCQSISQLAKAHKDYTSAAAFDQMAVQIVADHDLDVISGDLVSRLKIFRNTTYFNAFGSALVAAAAFDDPSDLTKKVVLIRVGSGLGALVAVLGPAAFEIIADCSFSGAIDPDRKRPTLFSETFGPLEPPLASPVRDLIDRFYFGFSDALGRPPESLMPGADGKPRKGATESVNKLLAKFGAPFTARDLRHLGVYRMLVNGDKVEKMARAARLSQKHFRKFYGPIL